MLGDEEVHRGDQPKSTIDTILKAIEALAVRTLKKKTLSQGSWAPTLEQYASPQDSTLESPPPIPIQKRSSSINQGIVQFKEPKVTFP